MKVFYFILWHFNHCNLKNHVILYINDEHREKEMPSLSITTDPSR